MNRTSHLASAAVLLLFCVQSLALGAERVVFIGDSHSVGSFGQKLDSLLRTRTPDVTTLASCGSSPSWWFSGQPTNCGYFQKNPQGEERRGLAAPTPVLASVLESLSPTVVVVAQGANLVNAPLDYSEQTSRQLAQLVRKEGVRCLWVGPPHGRNKPEPQFSEFYAVLKKAVAGDCDFIDSRPYAHYPDQGGDGVHYDHLGPAGRAIAEAWATSVFHDIELLLDEPRP